MIFALEMNAALGQKLKKYQKYQKNTKNKPKSTSFHQGAR